MVQLENLDVEIRAQRAGDFLGKARQQIDVPPLGEEELREVVSRPAQLLGAQFETDGLVDIIAQRASEESVKDVGALPLLSHWLRAVRSNHVDGHVGSSCCWAGRLIRDFC